jgi:UDP-N-acetylmuramoylalanine--D-glutamate ligase
MHAQLPDLQGANVTVMGLGLHGGGAGVTRFLHHRGAEVTVTDLKSREELCQSLTELEGLEISFTLGEHRESDFARADVVVVNPAVPLDSPYLDIAREHGARLTSELNLFVTLCPGTVVGITGSAGKSTTTSMIGNILEGDPETTCWVGGNLGGSLLSDVENITSGDVVVLEISSFQLLHLDWIDWSPSIAVVTNVFPNHLDRHGTFEAYARAKKHITRHQGPGDLTVLNREDDTLMNWTDDVHADLWTFSSKNDVAHGAWLENGKLRFRTDPDTTPVTVMTSDQVPVPGTFNLENTLAAICVAKRLRVSDKYIREGIHSFRPLPHHLEEVEEFNGVTFVDDSVSTTPDSTIAALKALDDQRVAIILGGYDKSVSLDGLADEVAERAASSVLMGETADRLKSLIASRAPSFACPVKPNLPEAVECAYQQMSDGGGVVLLSTASASYDMFQNYQERGRRFQQVAEALQTNVSS